jgi:hypothetical protein
MDAEQQIGNRDKTKIIMQSPKNGDLIADLI